MLAKIIEKSAISSWRWYHFLILYGFIPTICLVIPLLLEYFKDYFELDICHLNPITLYLSNFTHELLPHLASNLIFYFIFLTGVLFLEKNKLQFRNMMFFLFIILPIFVSISSTIFLQKACLFKPFFNTYGFSGIVFGFGGYFLFLSLFTILPRLFQIVEKLDNGCKESVRFIDRLSKSTFRIELIVIINFIIFSCFDAVGIASVIFNNSPGSTSLNNGLAHSLSFTLGAFLPLVFRLKNEEKFNNTNLTFLLHFEALVFFLTLYLLFLYYQF
jgi:hypothetical protein